MRLNRTYRYLVTAKTQNDTDPKSPVLLSVVVSNQWQICLYILLSPDAKGATLSIANHFEVVQYIERGGDRRHAAAALRLLASCHEPCILRGPTRHQRGETIEDLADIGCSRRSRCRSDGDVQRRL